jgi:hypothetical protein
MKRFLRGLVAVVCVAGAVAVTASAWLATGWVRTEDRNRDGRPDRWRFYNARGELTRVAIDTNFDGRSDEQDYYDHGALIRLERDRNLDDRVDLIETFDPTSHEEVRSLVDTDFNGTADLLVLFHGGRPVFSEWLAGAASVADVAPRDPSAPLAPLVDPSRHQVALQTVAPNAAAGGTVAVLSTMGLPENRFGALTFITGSRANSVRVQTLQSLARSCHSPRGPPPVSLV